MTEKEYFDSNRWLWDEKVAVHLKSDFYENEAFMQGKNVLCEIDFEALKDLAPGRKMLHLQCHFGQDSLCWQRLGARVTGIDFSEKAIKTAKKLNRALGQKAHFVHSSVYDLPENLNGKFDIVYTSWGTISWLPDLERWAQVVRHFLKKGGTFYIADFHPAFYMYDWATKKLAFDYFNQQIVEDITGTYAEKRSKIGGKEISWTHSLSETMGALMRQGLVLQEFREFDWSPYDCFPDLVEREPGRFVWSETQHVRMPYAFSLKMKG